MLGMKGFLFSLFFLVYAGLSFSQGAFAGLVKGPQREALAGAHVYVQESRQGALTDEQGRYRIEGLTPGVYTIRERISVWKNPYRRRRFRKGA